MRDGQIGLTLGSVMLIACGQVLFKVAARDAGYDGFNWRTVAMWLTPAMLAALLVSTLATGMWVWVLRSASLSVVYPLYALTYVLVPLLDCAFFGMVLTPRHWAGAGAIIGGVWLMSAATP
jgi:drug/metabolite transporter (DMT)-like permease